MISTNIKKQHFSAEKKLDVLLHADVIKNVSETCLHFKINRSTFYLWKKRYELDSNLGLKRRTNGVTVHPFKIEQKIVERIIHFSIENPTFGCVKIANELANLDIKVSSPTIQKILIQEKLGRVRQRLFRLEEEHINENVDLSSMLKERIYKIDPCFKELNKIGTYPGEILIQDTFPIFDLFPNTYIHVVIDTYSSYAFAYPWGEKSAAFAIDLLRELAFKFFRRNNTAIKKILTNRGCEFTKFNNIYSKFLEQHGITHELYSGKNKNWNGFIEKYKRNFFKRFGKIEISNEDVMYKNEIIQSIKNEKLNNRTAIQGYPNFGKSPIKMIKLKVDI